MADGYILIDTKLDDSGLLEGLRSLESAIGRFLQSAGAQASLFSQTAWTGMEEGIGAACAAIGRSAAQGIADQEAAVQAAMESLAGKLREGIAPDITAPYDHTKKAVEGAARAAAEAAGPFGEAMRVLGEGGGAAFAGALPEAAGRETAGAYIQAAQGGVAEHAPALTAAAGSAAGDAKDAVDSVLCAQEGYAAGSAYIGGVTDAMGAQAGALASAAAGVAQDAIDAAQTVLTHDAGSAVGRHFAQGMASGISGTAGSIAGAAKNAAQGAYEAAMAALDIHSPSRVMRWVGEMFGEGFAQGIEDKRADAAASAEALVGALPGKAFDSLDLLMGDESAAKLVRGMQAALDSEQLTLCAEAAHRSGVAPTGGGESDAAGVTVRIESLYVHTNQMNEAQDWQEAGHALAEAFARQARYRGVVVSGG